MHTLHPNSYYFNRNMRYFCRQSLPGGVIHLVTGSYVKGAKPAGHKPRTRRAASGVRNAGAGRGQWPTRARLCGIGTSSKQRGPRPRVLSRGGRPRPPAAVAVEFYGRFYWVDIDGARIQKSR